MEKILIETMNDFKYFSNLKSSPNKDKILYILSNHNIEKNSYDKNIYLFNENEHIQLTNCNSVSFFDFLDNDNIYFLSKRENKKNKTTIYEKSLIKPSEAKILFEFDFNVFKVYKVNDDLFLLEAEYFLDNTNYYLLSKEDKEKYDAEKENNNFRLHLDEIPFYNDGGTFVNKSRKAIFKYIPSKNILKNITNLDGTDVYSCDFKNNKLLIIAYNFKDKLKKYSMLLEYDVTNDNLIILKEDGQFIFDDGIYSNKYIYVFASDMKKIGINENRRIYRINKEKNIFEEYFMEDFSYDNSVGSDVRLGSNKYFDTVDDDLYCIITKDYYAHLYKISNNKLEVIVDKLDSVDGFAIMNNKIYTLGFIEGNLMEMFEGNARSITNINENILKDKYVAKVNEISFESNNEIIKGFVLLPENFDENKKYPAILDIHGGPKTVYGKNYYHEMQVWVNEGYVVMYTNPHGSSGRGDNFSDIRGKYGSIDYEDLMKFVDVVLEKYSNIDKENIGVTGGSYGGFMTNWIITHTNKFKAAVTQRSISNWISMYGVSDIGYYFADDQNLTTLPNEKGFEKLWKHSPLKYIQNVKTPTLIIHSDSDYRCPLEQGYQLFTALKDMGVDTEMYVFKNESHGLSRGGKPKARIERLKQITNWFNKYLKNGRQ